MAKESNPTETEKLQEQVEELKGKVEQIEIELKDVQKKVTKNPSLGLMRARFK